MTKIKPKISVVTPSYNQGEFLERTIKSIIDQSYDNFEYIIIDGNSSDDSLDIIGKYSGDITFWVSEPDNGQYHAISKGFERATGDILCWVNSDDVLMPGALSAVAEAFYKYDPDVVYGDLLYIDRSDRIIRQMRNTPMMKLGYLYRAGFGLSQPEVFWSKSLYLKVGGLNIHGRFAMDDDLFFRFLRSGAKFKHIRKNLSSLRFYEGTKTSTISQVGDLESAQIRADLMFGRSSIFKGALRTFVWAQKIMYFAVHLEFRYLLFLFATKFDDFVSKSRK